MGDAFFGTFDDPARAVRCAVLLNAAAGLYVSGGGWTFEASVERARDSLESGAAASALGRLRRTSTTVST